MNEVLNNILAIVTSVDPVLRTAIAGIAMFLETSILVGLVVPGDTIVIVSSTAVSSPAGYWALLITVIVGSLAGESLGFALGRLFGPRLRASPLGQRIGGGHWERAERYLARRGGLAVFISRFLPVLHALIPLTVGMSPMRYRRFIAWTAPACTLWAFAYITVGTLAAGSYRTVGDRLHYAGYLFVGGIVVFLLIALGARTLLHRTQSKHMDGEAPGPVVDGQGQAPRV
ncbi:DedA family protein [Naasia aerilata]|uniref:Membrane protein n=1 Tax=Naasia aerilata TaxID=1162966 RepID=A0ABN6XR07_9MICO|nr:DedA family protein [Naasia aerilata]BDZ46608.1 membrane protein [Naasia aerilata]